MFAHNVNKPVFHRAVQIASLISALAIVSGCVSHLKTAKSFYLEAEHLAADYRTDQAVAAYKRSLRAAGKEAAARPSAQAYMMKGLAEMKLQRWQEAQISFSAAFTFGFENGEGWARELALFGLASSFQHLGLDESAFRIHTYLLDRSRIHEVRSLAAQKYADYILRKARSLPEKERRRSLEGLLKKIDKLSEDDLACGYYHYVKSQVFGHLGLYRESLEEAVMARELGLPGEKILRDNDNQLIFCYRELKRSLKGDDWPRFREIYNRWIKKWGWAGPETPDWVKR
jgi:tetratricopeptide (TPR) repeat protein